MLTARTKTIERTTSISAIFGFTFSNQVLTHIRSSLVKMNRNGLSMRQLTGCTHKAPERTFDCPVFFNAVVTTVAVAVRKCVIT